ncbi:MAG: amino acid ABC transporter permease [Candidatus Lokiarchaeota archaeon]|nr:amino acid ABC transporter permease [Candidatus Lokiarchaeota archaeon]
MKETVEQLSDESKLKRKKLLLGASIAVILIIVVIILSNLFCTFPFLVETDYCIVTGYWDRLFAGFLTTMWLYGWALMFGFLLGLFLALLRQYAGSIFSRVATGYIEIIRGTPLVAQLFFLYYGLNISLGNWNIYTQFTIFGGEITFVFLNSRILFGIIALSLNSAAYQAEYLRGAMMSVSTGQLMAAQSLGMSKLAGIRHIILPQALRRVIPAWSNEAAYLPKYTVVVSLIGATELFGQAKIIVSQEYISIFTYIIVAIIFLVTIAIISRGLDILHKRTGIPGL